MAPKINVAVVDTMGTQHGNITPLALGYLKAYAEWDEDIRKTYNIEIYNFGPSEPVAGSVFTILGRGAPALVAFSCMGWNVKRHLSMAYTIKQASPETAVVFGGNHVSHQGDRLLRQHPAVDVVVNGEGEETFRQLLLRRAGGGGLEGVDGLSYRSGDGVRHAPPRERLRDLDRIPSPYLGGALPLGRPSQLAILETNRGCPYRCSFCYWGGATNQKLRGFSAERVRGELEMMAKSGTASLYVADANFGILEQDWAVVEALVRLKREYGFPKAFYTNWAKNKSQRILDMARALVAAGIVAEVTVATQTMNEEALVKARRRNIRYDDVRSFMDECRRRGVLTHGELIWGLPGETLESFLRGYDQLRRDASRILIYPLYVLPNTEYDEKRREYQIVTAKVAADTDWDVCVQTGSMSYGDFIEGMCFVAGHLALQSLNFAPAVDEWRAALGLRHSDVVLLFNEFLLAHPHPLLSEFRAAGLRPLIEQSLDPYRVSAKAVSGFARDKEQRAGLARAFREWLGARRPRAPHEGQSAAPDAIAG